MSTSPASRGLFHARSARRRLLDAYDHRHRGRGDRRSTRDRGWLRYRRRCDGLPARGCRSRSVLGGRRPPAGGPLPALDFGPRWSTAGFLHRSACGQSLPFRATPPKIVPLHSRLECRRGRALLHRHAAGDDRGKRSTWRRCTIDYGDLADESPRSILSPTIHRRRTRWSARSAVRAWRVEPATRPVAPPAAAARRSSLQLRRGRSRTRFPQRPLMLGATHGAEIATTSLGSVARTVAGSVDRMLGEVDSRLLDALRQHRQSPTATRSPGRSAPTRPTNASISTRRSRRASGFPAQRGANSPGGASATTGST